MIEIVINSDDGRRQRVQIEMDGLALTTLAALAGLAQAAERWLLAQTAAMIDERDLTGLDIRPIGEWLELFAKQEQERNMGI